MISVTSLSGYLYCQRRLYLKEVLGVKEPINASIVKGSIRHEVIEKINKEEENIIKKIEDKDFDKILNLYNEKHLEILKNVIEKNKKEIRETNLEEKNLFNENMAFLLQESKLRAKNIFELIRIHNVLGEELFEKVIPKIKSEFKIESKTLNLKGIIDRIDVYEDRVVPFELKTGKNPSEGVWPGHRVQIAAYCMLLEDYFKTRVNMGAVHYIDSGIQRDVVLNPFLRAEINELVIKVQNLLSSKELPKITKNQAKCAVCGLREVCFNAN